MVRNTAGCDPDRLAAAVAALRAEPWRFRAPAALATSAGCTQRELDAAVAESYHTTPTELIDRARVAFARQRLAAGAPARDAALAAGFPDVTALRATFLRLTGLSPQQWARLGDRDRFALTLPADYRPEATLRVHGRDAESPTERVKGRTLLKVLNVHGRAVPLEMTFHGGQVRCRLHARSRPGRHVAEAAHAAAVRMLGLAQQPMPFEQRVHRSQRLRALIAGRTGTRVPLAATPFEALIWCIVGQQINLRFAYQLRRTLITRAGTPAGDGLRAHPTAAQLAALDPAELRAARFSQRKAEYVIDTARAIAEGRLPFQRLADEPAPGIEATLLAVRGLGPWSVQYVMMRGFGLADCVPAGDSGLATALERFFALDHRPDAAETRALMHRFAPHRSLATFHFWLSLGDSP